MNLRSITRHGREIVRQVAPNRDALRDGKVSSGSICSTSTARIDGAEGDRGGGGARRDASSIRTISRAMSRYGSDFLDISRKRASGAIWERARSADPDDGAEQISEIVRHSRQPSRPGSRVCG